MSQGSDSHKKKWWTEHKTRKNQEFSQDHKNNSAKKNTIQKSLL